LFEKVSLVERLAFFVPWGLSNAPLSPSFSHSIASAAERHTVSSPATRDETYGKGSREIVPALEGAERMGPNNTVITWFPDSKRILFLSRRDTFNDWFGRLFSVSIDGGLPERLPLDKGGLTSFSPDGTKIAYNRIFRNFRTWKRYMGGMAQDIAIYDFKNNTYERITDYPGTDITPCGTATRFISVLTEVQSTA
jgi:hypothetical protein